MFEQTFLPAAKSRKPWCMALALAGQLLLVGLALLIPYLYVQQIPVPQVTAIWLPPPPAPPPPSRAAASAPHVARVTPRHFDIGQVYTPRAVPKQIATIHDLPQAPPLAGVPDGIVGGVTGGQIGGVIGGIVGSIPSNAPPPPPPPEAGTGSASGDPRRR
jgi:periplasmic protein TonB